MRARLSFGQTVHVYFLVLAFGGALYLIGLFVGSSYQAEGLSDAEIAEASMKPVEDLSTQLEFYEQLSDQPVPDARHLEPPEVEEPDLSSGNLAAEPVEAEGNRPYTIQVGAHSTEDEARQLLMKLEAKEFSGQIRAPGEGEQPRYFRVWVGEFATMEEAEVVATDLKEAGFYTYIRRVE